MKKRVTFIGNASLDVIKATSGRRTVFGGSAVNSAIAASLLPIEVNIITKFGMDYPLKKLKEIKNVSFQMSRVAKLPSNRFLIDEIKDSIRIKGKKYLSLEPVKLKSKTNHLHISCRKGIDTNIYSKKIVFDSLSFDVMKFSILEKWSEICQLTKVANFCFCNIEEFKILRNKFRESREKISENLLFVVTLRNGVRFYKNDINITIQNRKKKKIKNVSVTGAGDSFIGSFLSYYMLYDNIYSAAIWGQVVAKNSISDFGVAHLVEKKIMIMQDFKSFLI